MAGIVLTAKPGSNHYKSWIYGLIAIGRDLSSLPWGEANEVYGEYNLRAGVSTHSHTIRT